MKTPARKQSLDHADFARIRARAVFDIPRPSLDTKVSQAVDEVRRFCRGKNAAYAWSGGKDSIALGLIAQLAGIDQCMLAITDLEYPDFLAWVTQHMPDGLEVINTGQDLDWLVARPAMLFPQDAGTAAMWFAQVQHAAQRRFYKARGLDVLLLGRLHQYAECWPSLWHRMIARVPGAATAARYARTELYGFGGLVLPPGHTWRTWYDALVAMWPPAQQQAIRRNVAAMIGEHNGKTGARPIPMEEYDALSGASWKFFCELAIRGDLKGRRAKSMQMKGDRTRQKRGITLEQAREEAGKNGA